MNFYKDKTILVTGGAGSIGSEIVRKISELEPKVIRVFDNDETALFNVSTKVDPSQRILRPLYGDIGNVDRLDMAMEDVDIVFHTAAMKHVPICEYNPFEAIKTNVIGTQNVIQAALNHNVDKFILISTDKAVNPLNVMGTTKQLAEKLVISSNHYRGNKRTKLSCVRFGNVMNSRGSVVPIFLEQIKMGGPVTVTNPDMTRFMMTIPEAVDFILHSAEIAMGREIFIKKMKSVRLCDLADIMIDHFASKLNYDPDAIEIEVIGKRDGEKVSEELFSTDEVGYVYENDEIYVILPQYNISQNPEKTAVDRGSFSKIENRDYSSNKGVFLDDDELHKYLDNIFDVSF
ncbi:UDP-N-acetylglucosamine 4,6-dehydratase family protein [Methanoplanus endosymbiosus]|uniref:Polysaccharide biosynthesis protein n=1 Tax=Methanoplanus endosymbiosus TaxID=33865 RepID=A0A9E7PLA9_9EURY|nr:polysaccharide biosynthesis protein [Methanoplanus endosymbiosus]UUX92254.1 polysaccharide biosynthesis protein [Methanoplanus endosymbiosus]